MVVELALSLMRFETPGYLTLLLVLPLLVWLSFRSLSGLGGARRIVAISARCLVLVCMVLALAGAQKIKTNNTLGVIFAVDRSNSISKAAQQREFEFLRKAREAMRPDDQFAVIAFDGGSSIEQLPMATLGIDRISEPVQPDQTNIAAALRMAMALFPSDSARRLVLISDGNENVGQCLEEADLFRANKVPVDVSPIEYELRQEVVFDKLVAPATAKAEETINLQMVLRSERSDGKSVTGKIMLYQNDELIDLDPNSPEAGYAVTLDPGLTRLTVPVPLRSAIAHRFRAEFKPDDATEDQIPNNNIGQAFTIVSGQGPILILTSADDESDKSVNKASAELLAKALESEKLVCRIEIAGSKPLDPVRLLDYSLVIMSNVPANTISEEEQTGLASYVRDVGGGLVMIGGDQSFGAGGWMNTPIEEIMPVSFDVKNKKQIPKGALALVMHACEIPRGNYWGERVAVAAVKTLSSRDLVGVLSYQWINNKNGYWDVPLQTVGDKRAVIQGIMQMQMGDMPDLDPVMRSAVDTLIARTDAAAKHMIVISDFDPQPPADDLIVKMQKHGVTCSTVAIGYGGHAIDEPKARWIATSTGGKFYRTNNYSELPQIFIKESTIVRRALINENAFTPILQSTLPQTVAGLAGDAIPGLRGYVVTTPRPLADTPLVRRTEDGLDPVLAHWQVGLGRTVAFTSGMWPRWGSQWASWPKFSKLWAQIARWASRQSDPAAFDVSTSLQGGKGKIRIDALDKNASAIDFLTIHGTLLDPAPHFDSHPLKLTQTGPGQYEAEFDARLPGNYLINLEYGTGGQTSPQQANAPGLNGKLQTGLSVPYSPEYRVLKSNMPLLHELSSRTGGRMLNPAEAGLAFERSPGLIAETRRPIWEDLVRWMLILFLLDVAVRRIAISPLELARKLRMRIAELAGRIRPAPATAEAMAGLKATRQRVRDDLKAPQAPSADAGVAPTRSARYEAPVSDQKATEDLSRALGGASEQEAPVVARPTRKPTPTTEAEYTSRLLKAKRRAREDIDKDSQPPG